MGSSGLKSCTVKIGHQPEASLAWAYPARGSAKRRQRGLRPRESASKANISLGSSQCQHGRQHLSAAMAWREGLTGVFERGTGPGDPSRNLGGPRPPSKKQAGMGSGNPIRPRPVVGETAAHHGSERSGRCRRYRRAKATERGGTGPRESESLVVPTKPGNRPEGPGGGKGAPVKRDQRGER